LQNSFPHAKAADRRAKDGTSQLACFRPSLLPTPFSRLIIIFRNTVRGFREMSLHGQCLQRFPACQRSQSPGPSFLSGKVYILCNYYTELRPPSISYRPLNPWVYIEMRKFTLWQYACAVQFGNCRSLADKSVWR
jgi:hypothetical protein